MATKETWTEEAPDCPGMCSSSSRGVEAGLSSGLAKGQRTMFPSVAANTRSWQENLSRTQKEDVDQARVISSAGWQDLLGSRRAALRCPMNHEALTQVWLRKSPPFQLKTQTHDECIH